MALSAVKVASTQRRVGPLADGAGVHRPARIAFAGGGTLGHLMPGIAVADELRRREPDCEIMFVCPCGGVAGGFMRTHLAARGIRLVTVSSSRWQGAGWLRGYRALRGLPALTHGLFSAIALVRRFRPDVVVGLGGYGSVPTVLAADLLGVPTVILEQNARPGKANRLLGRWAQTVCCAWPGTETFFTCPARVTGNPVRDAVSACATVPASAAGGTGAKTLLVMGGSTGAVGVNELMISCLPYLEAHRSRLRILHSTGALSLDLVRRAYRSRGFEAVVTPFIEDMAAAYRASDLVVCRAGATSLAELCAAAKPAVLIPFPYAAEDHQRANAMCLVSAGAAVAVDQFSVGPAGLGGMIAALLDDEAKLREMSARSRALARPEAAGAVADEIQRWLCGVVASRPSRRGECPPQAAEGDCAAWRDV